MSVEIGPDAGSGGRFYEKLGHAVAHGPFVSSTNLYDDDGRPIHVGAVMPYLTKSLDGT
jgi:hypothetical protein